MRREFVTLTLTNLQLAEQLTPRPLFLIEINLDYFDAGIGQDARQDAEQAAVAARYVRNQTCPVHHIHTTTPPIANST